jgi:hypothetical protein
MAVLYTFATMKTELLARLGGRTDLSTRPDTWINTAMEALATCKISLPKLEAASVSKTLVPTANEYDYTATGAWNLQNVLGIRGIRNATAQRRMTWFSWAEYRELPTLPDGTPNRWTRNGYLIAFDQKPTTADTIFIDYRKHPTHDVLTDFEDQWLETILDMATFLGWKALQDFSQAVMLLKMLPGFVQAALTLPMSPEDWEADEGDRALMLSQEYARV